MIYIQSVDINSWTDLLSTVYGIISQLGMAFLLILAIYLMSSIQEENIFADKNDKVGGMRQECSIKRNKISIEITIFTIPK